jgi:hypothetical protein
MRGIELEAGGTAELCVHDALSRQWRQGKCDDAARNGDNPANEVTERQPRLHGIVVFAVLFVPETGRFVTIVSPIAVRDVPY